MLDGRSLAVRSGPRMGLGRLFMRHVCSNLGWSSSCQSDMFCDNGMLARVLGRGVLRRGLLLYVLPL